MTENEAIKELETSIDLAKMCIQNCERKREIQGYEMAIKALEEVQQYRKDRHGGGMPEISRNLQIYDWEKHHTGEHGRIHEIRGLMYK